MNERNLSPDRRPHEQSSSGVTRINNLVSSYTGLSGVQSVDSRPSATTVYSEGSEELRDLAEEAIARSKYFSPLASPQPWGTTSMGSD